MTECLKSQGMSKCWLLWNNELVTENMNLLEHKSISHIALNFSPSWVRYGVPFTNDLDLYNSILFHHSNFSATVPTSFRQQRQHKLQLPMRQIKFHMWRYSKPIQMTNDNDPSNVYQVKINIHGNAMEWEAFPQYFAEKSLFRQPHRCMMTSSNGNIFHVTGPLCGEFPAQRPVTRSFGIFFDQRLNKRLSKQSRRWWFGTPSFSLWRHCNGNMGQTRPLHWGHVMWSFGVICRVPAQVLIM